MKNDFELIVHSFEKPITIYPISDVHLGSLEHNSEEWEKFVNQIFPEDVKKYYTSFVSIYDREVNRNTLKKVVKSGFPKKKKALKKLTNSLKETIGLLDEYLKYVLDNILWLETEK